MSLREQISGQFVKSFGERNSAPGGMARTAYQTLKRDVHQAVLDRVELERLSRLPNDQVREEIATLIARILDDERVPANDQERKQLVIDVYDEMFGFGPLESLLRDPTVSDILVNTSKHTYV